MFLLGVVAALPGTRADTAGDGPIVPLTVCEIVNDLPMYDGQPVAALGRYSFREKGRWLGEQSCAEPPRADPTLWLLEDIKDGPHPPNNFALDAPATERKLTEIRKRTTLAKFRFGTPDYDRWAVVYGRIEIRKGDAAKLAPADLAFRGDGVVIFLNN
ncbi:MAG: hypothetical protein JO099_15875 [Acidobacteriia bacterium]|nr:hypothetical protein [Terriglobia bacterium]